MAGRVLRLAGRGAAVTGSVLGLARARGAVTGGILGLALAAGMGAVGAGRIRVLARRPLEPVRFNLRSALAGGWGIGLGVSASADHREVDHPADVSRPRG